MKEKLKGMLEKYTDVEVEIMDDTSVYDLGMNSLDLASFIGDIEDEFGCIIEEEKMSNIETVKDLIEIIKSE